MAVDDQSKISFSTHKGRCLGNQLLLVLVHGCRRAKQLVAQPGIVSSVVLLAFIDADLAIILGGPKSENLGLGYNGTTPRTTEDRVGVGREGDLY